MADMRPTEASWREATDVGAMATMNDAVLSRQKASVRTDGHAEHDRTDAGQPDGASDTFDEAPPHHPNPAVNRRRRRQTLWRSSSLAWTTCWSSGRL
jgi:hypothetical protein